MALTREENEVLTRVGPGTPMGEMMRRYWLPALLADELPEPDCAPVRVRLLGEDLVAFRDSDGRIGLLDEFCSHRRMSLFFGRNEECGLRCVYHGWKYDVEGRILETPVEPEESMIRHHVRQRAYLCREVNGVVFTYMGPPDKMPGLPAIPCVMLPEDQVQIGSKFLNECSWLQALEGDCDSTHSAFLHRRDDGEINITPARLNRPTVEAQVTRWGVRGATLYPADAEHNLVRTNVFVMPCTGNVAVGRAEEGAVTRIHTIFQVPRDDYTVWRFDWVLNRVKPLEDSNRTSYRHSRDEVGPDFRKHANFGNNYLMDREKQRAGLVYSGVDAGFHVQDACATEAMGPITDRTTEHLGVGDLQIAAIRQFLLNAIADFQRGIDPPSVASTADRTDLDDFYMVNAVLPKGVSWKLGESRSPVSVG